MREQDKLFLLKYIMILPKFAQQITQKIHSAKLFKSQNTNYRAKPPQTTEKNIHKLPKSIGINYLLWYNIFRNDTLQFDMKGS